MCACVPSFCYTHANTYCCRTSKFAKSVAMEVSLLVVLICISLILVNLNIDLSFQFLFFVECLVKSFAHFSVDYLSFSY